MAVEWSKVYSMDGVPGNQASSALLYPLRKDGISRVNKAYKGHTFCAYFKRSIRFSI